MRANCVLGVINRTSPSLMLCLRTRPLHRRPRAANHGDHRQAQRPHTEADLHRPPSRHRARRRRHAAADRLRDGRRYRPQRLLHRHRLHLLTARHPLSVTTCEANIGPCMNQRYPLSLVDLNAPSREPSLAGSSTPLRAGSRLMHHINSQSACVTVRWQQLIMMNATFVISRLGSPAHGWHDLFALPSGRTVVRTQVTMMCHPAMKSAHIGRGRRPA